MIESALLGFSHGTGIHGFMNSAWGWPLVESLHFLGLSLLIGTIGVFDLRMLGIAKGVSMAALHKLVPYGVGGYVLNVTTGTMFVSSEPGEYLYNPAFQTKMLFMAGAGINMLVFYRTTMASVRTVNDGGDAPSRAKLIAGISLACWLGVITCGRLITYYRPPYHWCFWC